MKKKLIILLLFFSPKIFFSGLNAQSLQVDSLKQVLILEKEDSCKLDILEQISKEYVHSNLDSAKVYIEHAKSLTNNFKDTRLEQQLIMIEGKYYLSRGDFQKAHELFLKGAKLAEQLNLKSDYFFALNDLQAVNYSMGNYKKAILELEKLIPLANELNDEESYVMLYSNIAMNFILTHQPDSARKYFDIAYPLTKPGDFYRAAVSVNLAYLNYLLGNYDKTLKYAKESAEIAQKLNRTELLLEALTNISNAYYEKKEYDKVVEYSTKVMKIAGQKKLRKQLANSYGNLSMAYERMGKYKTALNYLNKYLALHDSLINAEMTNQISELQIKYETEKKDKALRLKDAALAKQKMKLNYSISAVVLVSVFGIIVFILYRKKNQAYKDLVQRNMELVKKGGFTPKRKTVGKDKYSSSSLSDEKKDELYNKLEKLMLDEKVFLKRDLTLGKLAQLLEINSKYLSQVIHEEYKCGFSDFINNLRIQEAARMLASKSYSHISIEGISELVGYRSKSTFNAAFKKIMGVTPSFYSETSKNISSE